MAASYQRKFAVTSTGILKTPLIETFLDASVCRAPLFLRPRNIDAVAGWGAKESGRRAAKVARKLGVPVLYLEDGFLRSIRPGKTSPGYSLVIDHEGIYYDSTRPSTLESLLNSDSQLLAGIEGSVARAKHLILTHQLSKYNHAPRLATRDLREHDSQRVLVVDQTAGDNSVETGGANAHTFQRMLAAALTENPEATIYVKTHPEVSAKTKRGYLTDIVEDERTVVLRHPINPMSLVAKMDRVYTVTSTMGFEALLAGRQVTCFGIPWYSGWGVTDDRQLCSRRSRSRSIDELFAAAYFHYTTYINPRNRKRGDIFDVISWLAEHSTSSDTHD
ncbi:hypothetical protein [Ciceribacter thiooxidans]|uniref:Capsular polysaccharide export protein n=1 Tax=Ciceribacter thiooxidans TaxID=1969821 RepID=A0ABV7I232_9HYPH|nr:hypothetical protein [Ciceribacter thiooxidans]